MTLTNSNTYVEPTASTSLSTARMYQNDNFRSLLTNFKSTSAPTSTNLYAIGTNMNVPDGMLFRHETNGALYIADSVNKRGSPVGGNFTRVGIGNRVESTVSSLTTNASTYEIGELVVTLDTADEKLFLCKGTGGGYPTDFIDLGTPASYVIESSGNVTIQTAQTTVGVLVASSINGVTSIDASTASTIENSISAGATGAGSDRIFWENDQAVTSSYTITNGQNAMSAGPITINTGVTVTVGSGETWTVV